jgi:putative aldouronate transport system permease protein
MVSYLIVGFMALACLFPLWMALVASFSDESAIVAKGFSVLPRQLTFATYKYMIDNKGVMLARAFGMSLAVMVFGTIYTLAVTSCFAYVLAQKKETFRFAGVLSFIAWFTTIFSGGVLPWYILTTKYYGLQNNIFALFIPYGMNVFFMFILRNNFKAIPYELIEASKIDGASNACIFFRVALPLAKVGIVTIVLFTSLQYWNDFHLSLYLITKTELYTVQKLLYNLMVNITSLLSGQLGQMMSMYTVVPSNTARMVMTVLTVLPVAVFFPLAQKYFVRGITIGAVKG